MLRPISAGEHIARERGRAEPALVAVELALLGSAEVALLAAPARRSIGRITAEAHREHGNLPALHRKRMRKWGQRFFRNVAAKLATGGIDFEPAIERFVATLTATELEDE